MEGIEGASKTVTMNVHLPVGKNIGLGVSAFDEIGPVSETNYTLIFYTLKLAIIGLHLA